MSDEAMPGDAMSQEAVPQEAVSQETESPVAMSDNGTRTAVTDSDTATEGGLATNTDGDLVSANATRTGGDLATATGTRMGGGSASTTRTGAGAPADSGTCTEPGAPTATAARATSASPISASASGISPVRAGDRVLFRAHAAARLRGDTSEAMRLALRIGEEKRMAHLLYVLYLFTWTVYEELGDTPDPWDLADLTKRLHERHHRPGGGFWAIRAEAMVRGVCGDSALLTEVPVAAQPTYMWAVIEELIDTGINDARIGEDLDQAEAIGAELVRSGWDSMFAEVPAPRPAAAQEPYPAPEPSAPRPAAAPESSAAPSQEPNAAPTARATAPGGPGSDSVSDSDSDADPRDDSAGTEAQSGNRIESAAVEQRQDRRADDLGNQGREGNSIGEDDRPRDRESGGPANQSCARTDIEADQETTA